MGIEETVALVVTALLDTGFDSQADWAEAGRQNTGFGWDRRSLDVTGHSHIAFYFGLKFPVEVVGLSNSFDLDLKALVLLVIVY